MEYADAARNSFTPNQILWMAEWLIFNTGLFHYGRPHRMTPKCGPHFKNSSVRHIDVTAAQQAGYYAANEVFCMETTEHIASLTHKNQAKDEILQNLNNQLLNMRKEIEDLKKNNDHSQQQLTPMVLTKTRLVVNHHFQTCKSVRQPFCKNRVSVVLFGGIS
jgi:hypothetical protein